MCVCICVCIYMYNTLEIAKKAGKLSSTMVTPSTKLSKLVIDQGEGQINDDVMVTTIKNVENEIEKVLTKMPKKGKKTLTVEEELAVRQKAQENIILYAQSLINIDDVKNVKANKMPLYRVIQ